MRKFTGYELREFLESVDRHLARSLDLKILGGGAIILGCDVDIGTTDIDTFETDNKRLDHAVKAAQEETGLKVAVSGAGGAVGDRPWNSDDRLVRVMPHLSKLKIYVLEAHDVALSKAIRGSAKDYQAIEALHAHVCLSIDILVDRYIREMDDAIGYKARHDDNFAELIARLYGDDEGLEIAEKLRNRRGGR